MEVRKDFKTAFKTLLKHCTKQASKHGKVDVKSGHKCPNFTSILTVSMLSNTHYLNSVLNVKALEGLQPGEGPSRVFSVIVKSLRTFV